MEKFAVDLDKVLDEFEYKDDDCNSKPSSEQMLTEDSVMKNSRDNFMDNLEFNIVGQVRSPPDGQHCETASRDNRVEDANLLDLGLPTTSYDDVLKDQDSLIGKHMFKKLGVDTQNIFQCIIESKNDGIENAGPILSEQSSLHSSSLFLSSGKNSTNSLDILQPNKPSTMESEPQPEDMKTTNSFKTHPDILNLIKDNVDINQKTITETGVSTDQDLKVVLPDIQASTSSVLPDIMPTNASQCSHNVSATDNENSGIIFDQPNRYNNKFYHEKHQDLSQNYKNPCTQSYQSSNSISSPEFNPQTSICSRSSVEEMKENEYGKFKIHEENTESKNLKENDKVEFSYLELDDEMLEKELEELEYEDAQSSFEIEEKSGSKLNLNLAKNTEEDDISNEQFKNNIENVYDISDKISPVIDCSEQQFDFNVSDNPRDFDISPADLDVSGKEETIICHDEADVTGEQSLSNEFHGQAEALGLTGNQNESDFNLNEESSDFNESTSSADPSPTHHQQVGVGFVAPFWIPDEQAPNCQECECKFTVIKRRHHCRGCGRVLCSSCCHFKAPLLYMEYKEARVCIICLRFLKLDKERTKSELPKNHPPDPNNPMDYCSTVPIHQQVNSAGPSSPPSVMVPVGVLKKEFSNGGNGNGKLRENKQVIFSDGIRPGGDLQDSSPDGPPAGFRSLMRSQRKPAQRLLEFNFDSGPKFDELCEQMRNGEEPVLLSLRKNFSILVKNVTLDCCLGLEVWNIATRGLCNVGQDEMVLLLQAEPGENCPPVHVFALFNTIYQEACKGNIVSEMGHTVFAEPEGFLGSKDHGGLIYIRPTFQCLQKLILPAVPYLFAILIHKWETPWAKVFPLRLVLRLGAEFRYYPCPLVSVRKRKSVYGEIGQTIMNLLVDFRNYTYTIPCVQGMLIHMENKKMTILLPKNRYDQVLKALNNSNDSVLALSANFSPLADSHLVAVEDEEGRYSTQAINIHNKPRKITGASFIVFNGALKHNAGLRAKSSIVEDGLMVQIPSDMMMRLQESLRAMKDFKIECGPASIAQPDELVIVRWNQDDKNFNVGVKSPIDGKAMDGIASMRVNAGTDFVNREFFIRWTEVFIIQGETMNGVIDINITRLSENLARAFCMTVSPHLPKLYTVWPTKLGLRVTLHQDNVGYDCGMDGTRLASQILKELDAELVPIVHRAASCITDRAIVLELVFHIIQ